MIDDVSHTRRVLSAGRRLYGIACLAIGLVFLSAGVGKLIQPYDFLATVYSYGILGPELGFAAAYVLPWLELVIAVSLLSGLCVRGGLMLSTVLLGLFVAAKASAVHQELEIGCGCVVYSEGKIIGLGDVVWTAGLLLLSSVVLIGSLRTSRGLSGKAFSGVAR